MSSDEDSQAEVVHADDFRHPPVLGVVQGEASIFRRHLQAESAELPECLRRFLVDRLIRKIFG